MVSWGLGFSLWGKLKWTRNSLLTTSLRDLGKWMCDPWDQKTLSTGQNFQFLPIWSVIYSNALEFSAVIMFTNFSCKNLWFLSLSGCSDVAQKCYCGSANCRGYLGQTKQTPAMLKVVTLDRELGSPRSPSSSRRRPRQRIQSDADSAVSHGARTKTITAV